MDKTTMRVRACLMLDCCAQQSVVCLAVAVFTANVLPGFACFMYLFIIIFCTTLILMHWNERKVDVRFALNGGREPIALLVIRGPYKWGITLHEKWPIRAGKEVKWNLPLYFLHNFHI